MTPLLGLLLIFGVTFSVIGFMLSLAVLLTVLDKRSERRNANKPAALPWINPYNEPGRCHIRMRAYKSTSGWWPCCKHESHNGNHVAHLDDRSVEFRFDQAVESWNGSCGGVSDATLLDAVP